MGKYSIAIIIFIQSLLLLQSYSYSAISPSEIDILYDTKIDFLYNSVKETTNQNKWEKAKSSFEYLKKLLKLYNQQDRFKDLDQLETQVNELITKNLEQLYQKGLNQLDNAQFLDALTTFKKILHYHPNYKNTREFLEKTQSLRNTVEGITQKTTVVTSKTPDKKQTGLRIYKPEKCFPSYTLFALQILEGTLINRIYLIDMKGDIVYQCIVDGDVIFPRLKPDGTIIYNNPELIEIDFHGNTIWNYPAPVGHDFHILENGNIIIERNGRINESSVFIPNRFAADQYICPHIEIISPGKNVLWKWQGDKHTKELENLLGLKIQFEGDWAHNNTCFILKDNPLAKKDQRFKKGNIVFSYHQLNLIGIIDYPTGEIVWAWGPGVLDSTHSPTMLDNGNFLIFDNGSAREWSRIIELNPLTEEIVWEYHAETKKNFFSHTQSSVLKLPNGNILISEATSNRIFEITLDGEIVWDYISNLGKSTGCHGIYRAHKYSPEYVKPLLDKLEKWRKEQQ